MRLWTCPATALYPGARGLNDAANWNSPADELRMLEEDESAGQAGVLD